MTLAYLDPGTGSLLVSAVVGGAAAAGVAAKQARSRIVGALGRKRRPQDTLPTEATPVATPAPVTADATPAGDDHDPA